jgi:hypothetical protein
MNGDRRVINDIVELGAMAATVIPSYHKSDVLQRIKNTFMYAESYPEMPLVVFLQDATDVPKYQWLQPEAIFWVPPVVLKGIAEVRAYIQQSCTSAGMKYLLMLDDDLRFTYRSLPDTPNKWLSLVDDKCPALVAKSTTHKGTSFLQMVAEIVNAQQYTGAGVVSVVQRFGSQNKTKAVWNNRILHVFFMDLEQLANAGVFFNAKHPVVEDFRFLFDCALAGIQTYTLVKYVQDDYVGNTKGGCNEWRNGEHIKVHNDSVMALAEEFPTFCSAVWEEHSPYCSTGAFNPRANWRQVNATARRLR